MKKLFCLTALLVISVGAGTAATINVDLSGAVGGSTVTGVNASFAQTFNGQTVSGGIGISGSPTNPLSLLAAGNIDVAFFNPGVSAQSNSLLSQPGNGAPLSMLLASDADSLTWTMGSGNGGSITAAFFSATGSLVGSETFSGLTDYAVFSASGVGTFRGVTFYNDNDGAGLRFQNFSYNSVAGGSVPEPSTIGSLLIGLGAIAFRRLRS